MRHFNSSLEVATCSSCAVAVRQVDSPSLPKAKGDTLRLGILQRHKFLASFFTIIFSLFYEIYR